MKQLAIAIISATLLVGGASAAEASVLNGSEIKDMISDRKVVLSTRFGKFPMRYYSNKKVVGDGSGTGLGRFFAPKETGRWWVSGKQLCQKWPTWYDGKAFCFTITKTGPSKIKWQRNDGATGTARIY